jgi:hypothetical protein
MRTMIHMNIRTRYTTLTDNAAFYPRNPLEPAATKWTLKFQAFWTRIQSARGCAKCNLSFQDHHFLSPSARVRAGVGYDTCMMAIRYIAICDKANAYVTTKREITDRRAAQKWCHPDANEGPYGLVICSVMLACTCPSRSSPKGVPIR